MDITVTFVAILLVVIIVFDFYVINKKGKYFSISAFIIRWSKSYPSIPFLLGFVCGHLFWSMDSGESTFKGEDLIKYKQCVEQIKK